MASTKEEKELWIEFAHAAMGAYSKPDDSESAETTDDIVDEMVALSAGYADAMLDEIDERFGETKKPSRRRARKDEDE